jgi:single-stranded-DNA-specific exonuclease
LAQRGYSDPVAAYKFLHPGLDQLADPMLLPDMDKAAERLRAACGARESVLIYGDYDVDGVTSAAILEEALTRAGARVKVYIPDRMDEGYGVHLEPLVEALDEGYKLVVTVDTGISATEVAAEAARRGIELIITDHHQPPAEKPSALAVVNPWLPENRYPYQHLAGVGVVLRLIEAVYRDRSAIIPYMQYAALGTVVDVAPLTGENRVIARLGLELINDEPRLGIWALLEVAGMSNRRVTAGHLGFVLGPRLNAAGRVQSAYTALDLLRASDRGRALTLARALQDLNLERQQIEQGMLEAADGMISGRPQELGCIVLAQEGWHPGVVGIVAARLVEKYHRPALLLCVEGQEAHGSARSIPGFNMHAVLTRCEDLLTKFGGHSMAAGLSLPAAGVSALAERLGEIAREMPDEIWEKTEFADLPIKLSDVDLGLAEGLQALQPYGIGNPQPVFFSGAIRVRGVETPSEGKHLKVCLEDRGKIAWGIAFNRGSEAPLVRSQSSVDALYTVDVNEWQGRRSADIRLKEWRPVCPVPTLQILDGREVEDRRGYLASLMARAPGKTAILSGWPTRLFSEKTYTGPGPWLLTPTGEPWPVDEVPAAIGVVDPLFAFDAALFAERGLSPYRVAWHLLYNRADVSAFLEAVSRYAPDRGKCGQVYLRLKQRGQGGKTLEPEVQDLWFDEPQSLAVSAMTRVTDVFCELGFARREGTGLVLVDAPPRRPLEEAASYRQWAADAESLRKRLAESGGAHPFLLGWGEPKEE